MGTIILVANTKGGAGKSTMACNIAVVLAQQTRDVLIFDADRQSSSAEWQAERKLHHADNPRITTVQRYGEIDETIESLAPRFDYTLIDVSGRDSDEMRSALLICDVLLVPVRPSQFDLSSLHTMAGIVRNASRINKKMAPYAFLSIAPTNPKGVEVEQACELIRSGYPEFVLMTTIIRDRKIYRDATAVGLGVTEVEDRADSVKSAHAEMHALVEEFLRKTYKIE